VPKGAYPYICDIISIKKTSSKAMGRISANESYDFIGTNHGPTVGTPAIVFLNKNEWALL